MRTKSAFTLIELILVIVILGLLAAVVTPKMYSMTDTAYRSLAESMETSLKSGSTFYYGLTLHPPSSFYGWVALADGGSDLNIVRVGSDLRKHLADPQADVYNNGQIVLHFKNGLNAVYSIDPNSGVISASYTGP